MRGEMLWFNEDKAFGFVRTEEGERLYVHVSGFAPGHVPSGRCAGTPVSFERTETGGADDGPAAVGVARIEDVPVRRARLRHRSGVR